MRILLTCRSLLHRGGSEMHVRDLALALRRRGEDVAVWSTEDGPLRGELEAAGVAAEVAPSPSGPPPDVVHGHQHFELALALLRHPGTPAVFTCHAALDDESTPPRLASLRTAVAVDRATAERLRASLPGVPVVRVANAVDLARFAARAALPRSPRRALVFSNYFREPAVAPLREACARRGVALDLVGSESLRPHARPETLLPDYDVVFAKGRCALEAMAVGCAVVLCGTEGLGERVTAARFAALRADNFGRRCVTRPLDAGLVERELAGYDAAEAARVRDLARRDAGLDPAVDRLLALYRETAAAPPEARAAWAAALPDELAAHFVAHRRAAFERDRAAAARHAAELAAAADHAAHLGEAARRSAEEARASTDELRRAYGTLTWRWRERAFALPAVRRLWRWSRARADRQS